MTRIVALILILPALAAAAAAQEDVPGARVVEWFEVVLHVDREHRQASDRNDGTAAAPYRTITAALGRAAVLRRQGQGVKVLVRGGVYREALSIGADEPDAGAPAFILEGAGDVIVSGSDVWTHWRADPASLLYRHDWPFRWGLAKLPDGWEAVADHVRRHPVLLRGEMVFFNGQRLRQVMSLEQARRQAGTYFVQDAAGDAEPGVLWLHPPGGLDPADATIEVAVRPSVLQLNRMSNAVVRNMTFQHAGTQMQWPAAHLSGCVNVLLDNCRFCWNNWNALSAFVCRDVTWRRVQTDHNGAGGLNGWRVENLLVEDCRANENNWRGDWGDFRGWATGQKFLSIRRAHFIRYEAVGNRAVGLWFDGDIEDVLIENANLSGNATRGLFLEVMQGPLTLRDSRIEHNGADGVFVTTAARIHLENNRIADNAGHQLHFPWLADEHIERKTRNFKTGREMAVRTRDWRLTGNVIAGSGDGLLIVVPAWARLLESFRADGNRYAHADRADAFGVFPRHGFEFRRLDLPGWRKLTGQDADSTFEQTSPEMDQGRTR